MGLYESVDEFVYHTSVTRCDPGTRVNTLDVILVHVSTHMMSHDHANTAGVTCAVPPLHTLTHIANTYSTHTQHTNALSPQRTNH